MRRALPVFLLFSACATAPRTPVAAPPGVERYGDAVDWKKAGDEAVHVLSGYLQTDTFNPPGNETNGARYLAAVLERDGIASTIHEFAPGRGSLIARLPATGPAQDKPLCLLSHIDVVPAEANLWPKDKQPLSGAVADGEIWGRGALDMKGMGAIETMAFVWLKRANVPLKRDVVLVAVADEEVSNFGIQDLLANHWDELQCGELVNEGGLGVRDIFFGGQTVFAISVAEKGTLWARVTAKGEAGHGSTPVAGRAPERLMTALRRLEARDVVPRIDEVLYELFANAGEQKGGFNGFVLKRPGLVNLFVKGKLLSKPPTRAIITDTCQVTGFEGKGSSPNVIPSSVSAILDCRLLPGTTVEAMLATLRELVKDDPFVTVEPLGPREANGSPVANPFFDALARQVTRGRADAVAGPTVSPGFTDSIYVREKGTRCYGLVPFEVGAEELGTMHGRDERVSVANVKRGLEVLFRAVVDVSARP